MNKVRLRKVEDIKKPYTQSQYMFNIYTKGTRNTKEVKNLKLYLFNYARILGHRLYMDIDKMNPEEILEELLSNDIDPF